MFIDDLKFGNSVLNGFQFIEQNPLGFFEFDQENDRNKIFNIKEIGFEAKGKVVVKENGFKPKKDQEGTNIANQDIVVVTRAKSRPVLIFQDVDFCKQYHNNVFIIPIQSIKRPEEKDFKTREDYLEKLEEYEKIKNKSTDIYHLYYIPKKIEGGYWERVLVLHDARFVHISTLFGQVAEDAISNKDIIEISSRLSKMLNIDSNNCSECEYHRMFDSIKKIMSRVERLEKNA